jgi:hypothetical protein
MLWEVNTRDEVHKFLSAAQIIVKVSHGGLRPIIPPGCIFADLMRKCWSQDPDDRPGFATLVAAISEIYTKSRLPLRRAQSLNQRTSLHNGSNHTNNATVLSLPMKAMDISGGVASDDNISNIKAFKK